MQWIFDKRHAFGTAASHLSLVSSGAADIVARANGELIDLALGEVRDSAAAGTRGTCRAGHGRPGEDGDVFPGAGEPSRPGTRHAHQGADACRRLDGYGLARYDRKRRRERPSCGRARPARDGR